MRNFLVILFLIFSVCQVQAGSYGPGHDAAIERFRSNDEPKVKDAVWTSATIFKIGMINDGSSRDGYAQYTCEVLYEYGFRGQGISVQVIDIVALTRKGEWNKMGEARCL